MKKSVIARIAAIGLAVGSLGAAGAVAVQAYPADCGSGRVCVYDNINYGTQLGWRSEGFALQDVSSGNNDKMSSWSNHTGTNGAWYADSSGGGFCFQMNEFTSNPDVGWPWNDIMSSWKGNGGC